jgi:hypothetical protein
VAQHKLRIIPHTKWVLSVIQPCFKPFAGRATTGCTIDEEEQIKES